MLTFRDLVDQFRGREPREDRPVVDIARAAIRKVSLRFDNYPYWQELPLAIEVELSPGRAVFAFYGRDLPRIRNLPRLGKIRMRISTGRRVLSESRWLKPASAEYRCDENHGGMLAIEYALSEDDL